MGRNQPAPLQATIASAAVMIGNDTFVHNFVHPVQNYAGQRLFVHATSDGHILTIGIDTTGPDSPPPTQDASVALITVTYGETETPEHWDIPQIAYTANTPVANSIQLDNVWSAGTLLLGAPLPAATGQASLDYVVVHRAPSAVGANDERYDMYWLTPGARFDSLTIGSATLIPDPGGSITGPFGISTP